MVSPFHGQSSHAAWAEGLKRHSRHRISVVEMEDRAWSWRLKGSSPTLSLKMGEVDAVDLVMATSMTCLSSLFGLLRKGPLASLAAVYYMHENQLTYPIRPGGKRDAQLVLRQFHSQLASDHVWFNSEHNRTSWFTQLPKFLAAFPDHQGLERLQDLERKSKVMPVGLELPKCPPKLEDPSRPILLWNQRWEWEKGIDRFSDLVKKLGPEANFDVVLLGPSPGPREPTREALEEFLGPRLLHSGWCDRASYQQWLEKASFAISTARHEFFGISLLEAAAHGLMLFLPEDLSYPEILPPELHQFCLYRGPKDLHRAVRTFLEQPHDYLKIRAALQARAYQYSWSRLVELYDEELEVIGAELFS